MDNEEAKESLEATQPIQGIVKQEMNCNERCLRGSNYGNIHTRPRKTHNVWQNIQVTYRMETDLKRNKSGLDQQGHESAWMRWKQRKGKSRGKARAGEEAWPADSQDLEQCPVRQILGTHFPQIKMVSIFYLRRLFQWSK